MRVGLALAAFILTLHDDAGGDVDDTYGGIGCIHALSAFAARGHGIDAQIFWIDVQVNVFGFWHDRNRDGGCVDTPSLLGFRHTLNAVNAAFKFQISPASPSETGRANFK